MCELGTHLEPQVSKDPSAWLQRINATFMRFDVDMATKDTNNMHGSITIKLYALGLERPENKQEYREIFSEVAYRGN